MQPKTVVKLFTQIVLVILLLGYVESKGFKFGGSRYRTSSPKSSSSSITSKSSDTKPLISPSNSKPLISSTPTDSKPLSSLTDSKFSSSRPYSNTPLITPTTSMASSSWWPLMSSSSKKRREKEKDKDCSIFRSWFSSDCEDK